jgi:hypothetical protein
MSAFMVEDQTINKVVTWLTREVSHNFPDMDWIAHKYGVDLVSEKWDEKLAHAMFQLNCDGVNARYGKDEAENFRPLNFTYKREIYHSSVQVLKSLRCWMYQCSEGDVPQTKLYRFFEEVGNYLALHIIMDLPEYDEAEWG